MKIWNTKYALSDGITEHEATIDGNLAGIRQGMFQYLHGEGKEWHRTLESAVAKANAMKSNRIASLKKQIAKLEKLDFIKIKPMEKSRGTPVEFDDSGNMIEKDSQ